MRSYQPLVHPDVLLSLTPPVVVTLRAGRSPRSHPGEHPVLEAQVEVAHTLEHAAQLE